MPYLKKADILDNVLNELLEDDLDPILERADRQLESLAQQFGIRRHQNIGKPEGATDGTPLVKGGAQGADTLTIDGLTATSGTIDQGTRVRIEGLRDTYILESEATVASGQTTMTFSETLQTPPADNDPVSFRKLHETVFDWMVAYVKSELCEKFMFTSDNPDADREDDKYFAKHGVVSKKEKKLRSMITREMIDNEIDQISDVYGTSGEVMRG